MSDSTNHGVLSYGGHAPTPQWTTIHSFYNEIEAQLCGNELETNGIRYQLLNSSTRAVMAMYGSFIQVPLQVMSDDVDRARTLLAEHLRPESADQLEPAEADDPAKPHEILGEDGEPVQLLAAGAFDSVHEMREASLILEAGRIEAYVPRLVAKPAEPHAARQFIVRVQEDDLPRARALLKRDPESDSAEPRCPRCGGWNVYEIKHEFTNMVLMFVGKRKPLQCECLKCHYVGLRDEFFKK